MKQRAIVFTSVAIVSVLGVRKVIASDSSPPPVHRSDSQPATGHQTVLSTKAELPKVPTTVELTNLPDQLEQLNDCYLVRCAYPDSDRKTYEFAVGRDIQKRLLQLAEQLRTDEHTNEQDNRGVSALAVGFLANSDGHVQEGALDVLASLPTSPEALTAILKNVIEGYDAELIEQGMAELERYQDEVDLVRIHQTLAQGMITGAPFTAREISAHISPFVTMRSVRFYRDLLGQLSVESVVYANLKAAVSEISGRDTTD